MIVKKVICTLIFVLGLGLGLAQDMPRVKQVIDTLCSESMHGRGYYAKGDRIAADYLKAQFDSLGLEPYADSFFQYFKLNINTFPNKVRLKVGKRKYKIGADCIVNAISQKGRGSGRLQILDSLIFRDTSLQNTFLDLPIHKRVMVIRSEDYQKIVDLPRPVINQIYSAKALIELKSTKLTAGLSKSQYTNPYFEIKAEDFDKTAKRAKFRLDAVLEKDYVSQNIIGILEGSIEPDTFVVFSAHYDHLGRMGKKVYFPGANDNASGIAMLLELVRYYKTNRPKYSIAFIAFGSEEVGLVGSKHYVYNPFFPLSQIKFLINVDLVGTGDKGATVVNGKIFEKEFEVLAKINEEKKYLPKLNKRGFAANSDHFFFTENGVPAFFIYTLGGITAYHDIYDRPETLPLTRFSEVFNLIKDFIENL